MRRILRSPVLKAAPLALLLPAAVALAGWPSGAEISPALLIDLTKDGLAAAGQLIPALLPSTLPIDDIHQTGSISAVDTIYWWLDVTNIEVYDKVNSAVITPQDGYLALDADATLWMNDSSNPFNISLDSEDDWFGINVQWADCDTYVDPFDLTIDTTVSLAVVDDGVNPPYLDATVGDINWGWDVTNDDVHLDCWIGDLDTILSYIGFSPVQMALDYAAGAIDDQLQSMKPQIEQAIEGAFQAANIDQTFDLNGATMRVTLHPTSVDITPDGVRVGAGGFFVSDMSPCVAEYGHTESQATPSDPPALASAPATIPEPHHIGLMADDDFVNEGLFAAYNGGLLCYTATADSGLPIDTTILSILDKDAFGPLFPTTQPMIIQTRPAEPPVAAADGPRDLNLDVPKLGVDFYANLDDRMALMVGADLDVKAGADLNFDPTAGNLAVDVQLSGDDITTSIRSNEFAPGDDDKISGAFGGLFDTIVQPLIGSALGGLSFPLPSVSGFGLTSLDGAASGPSKDWFGFYGNIGPVTYANDAGCNGGSGCGGSGGGCGTGQIPVQSAFFFVPLIVGLMRRRQR